MISANVGAYQNGFIATLSDGRHLQAADLRTLANELHGSGVAAQGIRFEWRAGQRMMTAGQQVALRADLRSRQLEFSELRMRERHLASAA